MAEEQSRFGVALDFACAAVTVLLSGHVADRLRSNKRRTRNVRPAKRVEIPLALTRIDMEEFREEGKYRGLFERVAKSEGVSSSIVKGIATGKWTPRNHPGLVKAIVREIKKVDAKIGEMPLRQLTSDELRELGLSGRYFGTYARVAKALGRHRSYVQDSVREGRASFAVLAAIRSEMERVDTEWIPLLTPEELREFSGGGRYYGVLSRVANALGIPSSRVDAVARLRKKSQPILRHIRAEMRRIDAEHSEASAVPLTADERAEFRRGGKYFGIGPIVARNLGISCSGVNHVLHGRSASWRILAALRQEMARVDASLAKNEVRP